MPHFHMCWAEIFHRFRAYLSIAPTSCPPMIHQEPSRIAPPSKARFSLFLIAAFMPRMFKKAFASFWHYIFILRRNGVIRSMGFCINGLVWWHCRWIALHRKNDASMLFYNFEIFSHMISYVIHAEMMGRIYSCCSHYFLFLEVWWHLMLQVRPLSWFSPICHLIMADKMGGKAGR